MGDGCDQKSPVPATYYGEAALNGEVADTFRKGSKFQLDFEPQKDRFDANAAPFWLLAHWRYDQPGSWTRGDTLIYWGREVQYRSRAQGQRLIVDCVATAEQFGSTSRLILK
jgi:hypothetical protein